MSAIRAAVVGVGSLGQHHARVYASLPGCVLAGVYDVNPERARAVAERHGAPVFERLQDVVAGADVASVAGRTVVMKDGIVKPVQHVQEA